MVRETIIIDGVRYYADRPRSCKVCFFWKNRKAGCTLKKENCYYLAESPKAKSPLYGLLLRSLRQLLYEEEPE